MEKKHYVIRDLSPLSSSSFEVLQKHNDKLIEDARDQLEIITPTLQDLIQLIIRERPDVVIFLDKGARIFGAPFRKILGELMGRNRPVVQRYNDDALKLAIFDKNISIDSIIKEDFTPFQGKRVLYIDETFSSGKGAISLKIATQKAGIEMFYYAITRDMREISNPGFEQNMFYTMSNDEYQSKLKDVLNDDHCIINNNSIPWLFTKDAAELIVVDDHRNKTRSRYELVYGEDAEDVHNYSLLENEDHARAYSEPHESMTWAELDAKVREINMRTASILMHMIYDALKKDAG